jgi:hypothetical protein
MRLPRLFARKPRTASRPRRRFLTGVIAAVGTLAISGTRRAEANAAAQEREDKPPCSETAEPPRWIGHY